MKMSGTYGFVAETIYSYNSFFDVLFLMGFILIFTNPDASNKAAKICSTGSNTS